MYCVSCCNTIILIYYIKRTDVRYTIYYLGIHYLTMYPTSCIVHYKSFVFYTTLYIVRLCIVWCVILEYNIEYSDTLYIIILCIMYARVVHSVSPFSPA